MNQNDEQMNALLFKNAEFSDDFKIARLKGDCLCFMGEY